MSATELVAEKARLLTEAEAQSVLDYIVQIKRPVAPTASELMQMPPAERDRILSAHAESAAKMYRENPDLIVEDVDPPLDYE